MKTNTNKWFASDALIKLKLVAMGIFLMASSLFAATRYVWQDSSSPAPPYTNWASAAVTIQQAVDVSKAGDSVLVTNGVYAVGERESFDRNGSSLGFNRVAISNAIALRSVNGPEFTVIDGVGEVRGVSLAAGASLSGFTISNGSPTGNTIWTYGGGVWCYETNALITNCVLTANFAYSDGGGVYGGTLHNCTLTQNSANYGPGGGACWSVLYNCTLSDNSVGSGSAGAAWGSTLVNCLVSNNWAFSWGGVGNCTLNNCEIIGNSSSESGGGAYGSTLQNCTLTGNSADNAGGGAYDCTLHNCTITGNSADYGGGASWSTLNNCIVYFNTALTEANYDAASDLNFCCTKPLPPSGIGNISLDPQLASASRISPTSPCRGAGSVIYATGTDLDGEPWGNPPSIGCDEYHAGAVTGPLMVSVLADYTNVAAGFPVALTAVIEGRPTASVWDFGDGVVVSNRPYTSHSWAAPGDYVVVLRAFNESLPGGVGATMTVHVVEAVYYVAASNPNPQPPYTSWATAATNIQDAVDAGVTGALVLVTNGAYGGYVEVYTPLTLRSVNGPKFTVIGGEDSNVYLADGASLSGFTLTNGWGLYCEPTAIASNCVITGNSRSQGGGARGGTLYNCALIGNSAVTDYWGVGGYGGGAYASTLYNCTLTGNSAVGGGGGGAYACTLYNCTLTGNSALWDEWGDGDGGGAYRCTLFNCTITGNSAHGDEWGDGGYGGGVYDCTLYNCVVYFNTGTTDANYDADSTLNYCCTTPLPASGSGNIALDPQLASASRLSAVSPCRGAGRASYVSGTDLDGELWGNPPAIGCDEYHAGAITGPLTVTLLSNHTNMTVGYPVGFTALIEGRPTASVWDFGDGVILSNRPYTSHSWTAVGDYVVGLRAYNETLPAGVSASVTIHVVQPVYYVAALSANPLPPYSSWATAARNIQDAVDAAVLPGASVLVTNGVYALGEREAFDSDGFSLGFSRVIITNAISLRSINGPQFTVINGGGTNRCISLPDGASLSGFTLTNGWVGVSCASSNVFLTNCVIVGSVFGGAHGGTLYNCTLTGNSASTSGGGALSCALYNCLLTGNSVGGRWASLFGHYHYMPGRGGGACESTLFNCTLTNNSSADYGGGAYSSTLYNCLLSGNTATGGLRTRQGQPSIYVPGAGSGAYGGTLYNCTLTGNSATDYGGGAAGGTLYNCIVYFNTASSGANYHTNSALNYCCTTPQPTNGVGNITNPPLFASYAGVNLRLQSNSPCINAGNNAYVGGSTDLDGNPRIVAGTVDIGAYEYQTSTSIISYAWLQKYGLPTDGSADLMDSDHDGMNNWREYLADTSPLDANDYLHITRFTRSGTYNTLWWASKSTRLYQVERRANWDTASPWETIITNSVPGWNNVGFDNTGPQYFYRIGAVQP